MIAGRLNDGGKEMQYCLSNVKVICGGIDLPFIYTVEESNLDCNNSAHFVEVDDSDD